MTTTPPERADGRGPTHPVRAARRTLAPGSAGRPVLPSPVGGTGHLSSPQLHERQAAGIESPATGAGSPCGETAPARGRTKSPAGDALDGARGVPAGTTAVTCLASLPPWPAPPDPADVLLQIRLGLPPVTGSRPRISPAEYTWIAGRKVKTKKAHGYKEQALAEYQETVGWLLRQCRVTRNDDGELGVYGVFHLAGDAGAADGDNLLKAIVDAGNGIAWKDDRQFTLWLARVIRGSADPHTDLVVYVTGRKAGAA